MSATLKNTQAAPLSIISIAISGGSTPADYLAGGNCPVSPSTLGPGESCTITVTFTPSAPGIRTATLTVKDDAHASPLTVAVKGMGVATISNTSGSGGLATTTGLGTTTIGAASGAINGSTTLTVTPGFILTGSLNNARYYYTATFLNNGLVLMAGGVASNGNPTTSAELYNPAAGTFTATGSLSTARANFTATLLNNGDVLVAGGYNNPNSIYLSSAELYSPSSGTFTATGSMSNARYYQGATLLTNGMVLIAGGGGCNGTGCTGANLAGAELYDPNAGTFTTTGSLNVARYDPTMTLLPTGNVLVAGGSNSSG